jgi:hypothetical protein
MACVSCGLPESQQFSSLTAIITLAADYEALLASVLVTSISSLFLSSFTVVETVKYTLEQWTFCTTVKSKRNPLTVQRKGSF